MTRAMRAERALCASCGRRCTAWLCLDCSITNDFFVMPRLEIGRLSPTTIGRAAQRSTDRQTEHDHFMAMQSHNQKWSELTADGVHHHHKVDPRITRNRIEHFTSAEHRRWTEILDDAGPRLGFFRLSQKRKAALERRRWERFCTVWSRIGLAAWTALIAPPEPKRRRKRKINYRRRLPRQMADLIAGE